MASLGLKTVLHYFTPWKSRLYSRPFEKSKNLGNELALTIY